MSISLIPEPIRARFLIEERRHAIAILRGDFPTEYQDILDCLAQFELLRSEVSVGGGGKTRIASRFDSFLKVRGWEEQELNVRRMIGEKVADSQTHKVDRYKNRVALEVEWNNKDPFFSRDLAAFRLFHELNEISVGVIVTRADELQGIFDRLGLAEDKRGDWKPIGAKYGASTTHWGKLMPHVNSGASGTCPVLLFGIKSECYRDDIPDVPIVTQKPT